MCGHMRSFRAHVRVRVAVSLCVHLCRCIYEHKHTHAYTNRMSAWRQAVLHDITALRAQFEAQLALPPTAPTSFRRCECCLHTPNVP